MCEILPRTKCFFCSYRIAMLFIAVYAVTSGVLMLLWAQRYYGKQVTLNSMIESAKNIKNDASNITTPKRYDDFTGFKALWRGLMALLSKTYWLVFCTASILLIVAGLTLLVGDLTDEIGPLMSAVSMLSIYIITCCLLFFLVTLQCIISKDHCLLKWDVATNCILLGIFLLSVLLWIFFAGVTNTYINP